MAGVLLFIDNKKSGRFFPKECDKLKNAIGNVFGSSFRNISSQSHDGAFLIFFEKEKKRKYFADNNGNWLAFEGTVFSLNKTLEYDAKTLLNFYKENKEQFVNLLDGHFVIKLYDKKEDSFFVYNDIIKSRSNYLVQNQDFTMITPYLVTTGFLKDVLPDIDAINEIFWRYYILSERTLFKGIDRLSPASIYKINSGKIDKKSYWSFPKAVTEISFSQSVDKMTESILESARLLSKVSNNPVSDLTLGQDSRLIVASFKAQNLPINTSIFGKNDFTEVKGVKRLSERHNITNHVIQLNDQYKNNIADYFTRSLLLASADEPGYLLGRILFMREQQSEFGDGLINGAGGPFYKDCFWEEVYALNFYREGKRINPNLFLKLRPMNKDYNDSFFNSSFLDIKTKSADYFINMLNSSIKGYTHLPLSMQIDKFSLTFWQNYAVRSNDMTNSVYNSFSPLLFRRNLEIGLPLPARWKWNKSNFQRAVMFAIDPKLAKEPTDFGGINMMPKNGLTFLPFYSRYLWRQSSRMRNKLLTKMGFPVKTHLQAAWDYKPLYKSLLQNELIRSLLNYDDMALASIVEKKSWQEWLNKLDRDDNEPINNYEHVLKIAGMEYIFKKTKQMK